MVPVQTEYVFVGAVKDRVTPVVEGEGTIGINPGEVGVNPAAGMRTVWEQLLHTETTKALESYV